MKNSPSILYTRASQELDEKVQEELEIEDPSAEQAKAVFQELDENYVFGVDPAEGSSEYHEYNDIEKED